jgi:LacI family transcriptional regulator
LKQLQTCYPMATIRSIAKRTGVSIATVSRVLNGSTSVSKPVRERVMKATSQAGYMPSVGKRSNTNIAVLYTGRPSLGSPFDSAVLQGMSNGLEQHGYDLLVMTARNKLPGETWAQLFLRKGVIGVVIRTDEQTRNLCRKVTEGEVPALVLADEFADGSIPTLGIDSRKATRQGMEHLIHLGHKRIAITLNVVDDHDHRQRLETFEQVLKENDIDGGERYILRVPAVRDAGVVALRQIMGMPNRPTAVFVTDPLAAVGMFFEAQKDGVVIPRDLSVIGFDDSQQRLGVHPRMSAVCQDAEQLGVRAMATIHGLIEGGNEQPADLECWLELHESTAAVAAAKSV